MNQQELYEAFLRAKVLSAPDIGIDVDDSEINPILKPHQRAIVRWALKRGRAAIFASFGLGKSVMQLEILRLLIKHLGGLGLIVAPLGVRQEFMRDAEMLGIPLTFIRSNDEIPGTWEPCEGECSMCSGEFCAQHSTDPCDCECEDRHFIEPRSSIYITNYESVRDGKLDTRDFQVVTLDEAACLRGFGGSKTFRKLMGLFEGSGTYRFVATATPSPNDFIELLAYSAFLDVMDISAAKTKFFKRNSEHADELTLMPSREEDFWLWCSTWAIFLQSPADLGFDATGYEMPEMRVEWHEVPSDHENAGMDPSGQGRLLRNSAIGLSAAASEKRDSIDVRISKLKEIVCDYAGAKSIPAGLLLEAQGAPAEREQCENKGSLRGQQGQVQSKEQALEGKEPRTLQATHEELCGPEQGKGQRNKRGMVPRKQRASGEDESAEQTEAIRINRGGVSGSEVPSEQSLPDMSAYVETTSGRSRSSHGQVQGNPLPDLQRSDRSTPGRSGSPYAGGEVSEQFVVWCELNKEQEEIDGALSDLGISFCSLYGNTDIDDRDSLLSEWKDRERTALVTKASMYGAGVNLQQCRYALFFGVGYKFYSFIQAIHRIQRFLQTRTVRIDIIYTEAEREIRRSLEQKWDKHKELVANMTAIIRKYGLGSNALADQAVRKMDVERVERRGDNWVMVNNDCVPETGAMDADSVHLVLTSIPFSTQYEYSPSFRDFGHTESNEHFWAQMDFLIPNLFRILKPGRVAAIHVKDRITPSGLTGMGFQTVYPFSDDCIAHFIKHGFGFLARKTIVTDVVRENNQTYRLGWTEQCKDGSRMGAGMPEYLLLFRKPPTDTSNGYADEPVVKDKASYTRSRWQIDAHGFMRSNGDRLLTPEDLQGVPHDRIFKLFRQDSMRNVYDFEKHVELSESLECCQECGHIHAGDRRCADCDCKIAGSRLPATFMLLQPQSWHPDVWTDITRMRTLNLNQSMANREFHVCPLQLDLVDRVINQFSMPGEVVFDPFAGIGTVPMRAVSLGRKGHGVELATNYFLDAAGYAEEAERKASVPTLFDLMGDEEGAA